MSSGRPQLNPYKPMVRPMYQVAERHVNEVPCMYDGERARNGVMKRASWFLVLAAGCTGGAAATSELTPANDPGGLEARAAGGALRNGIEASAAAYEPVDS